MLSCDGKVFSLFSMCWSFVTLSLPLNGFSSKLSIHPFFPHVCCLVLGSAPAWLQLAAYILFPLWCFSISQLFLSVFLFFCVVAIIPLGNSSPSFQHSQGFLKMLCKTGPLPLFSFLWKPLSSRDRICLKCTARDSHRCRVFPPWHSPLTPFPDHKQPRITWGRASGLMIFPNPCVF